jgi:hypothetical protein
MRALSIVGLLALCASCYGPWYDYTFAPVPQEARVADEAVPGAQARALITLPGIRRPADDAPARIELRLRLENLGSVPVELCPQGFALDTADLQSLPAARVVPPEPLRIEPGEFRVYDVHFDLPPGRKPRDYNLDGLAFKWELDFGHGPVPTSVTFQRVLAYVDDPYVQTHVGIGFGYVHCD